MIHYVPVFSCRGLIIAMVLSLLFIILLRFLAGIMVWVMIVMVILVLGYGKSLPPCVLPSPLSASACALGALIDPSRIFS